MRRLSLLLLLALPAMGQGILYRPGGGACGVNMTCTAEAFVATAASGYGLECQSASADGCVKLGPASCNVVGEDPVTGYVLFGKRGVCTPEAVDIGNTRLQSGQVITGGYFTLTSSVAGSIRSLSGPVPVEGVLRHVPDTLGTCNATNEFGVKGDSSSGGTTGDRSRICLCTSDGGGTPAYAWQNVVSGTVGTSTTCPP